MNDYDLARDNPLKKYLLRNLVNYSRVYMTYKEYFNVFCYRDYFNLR